MEKKFKLGPLKKRGKKEKASGEKRSIKLARIIIEKQNWIVSWIHVGPSFYQN